MSKTICILVMCFLFSLLCTFSSAERRYFGLKRLKASLTKNEDAGSDAKKTAGHSVDAGEAFLTNLYNSYFYKNGQMKAASGAISEIIHSVQGNVEVKTNSIHFNMEGINPKEYIQKAEIHVKVVNTPDPNQNASNSVKLGLYNNMTGELISTATLFGTEPTWTVFIVSAVVGKWLESPHTNRGVRVEVIAATKDPKTAPKVFMYRGKSGPFMVVYADGRRMKGVEDIAFFKDRSRRNPKTNTNATATVPTPDPTNLCSRRDLHINPKQIFQSIETIAPVSFNIFDCSGICDLAHPNGSFSNHAKVRWMAAKHQNQGDPILTPPCCVPTGFNVLGVLYTTKAGHVVFRQYKNMVATECGCR